MTQSWVNQWQRHSRSNEDQNNLPKLNGMLGTYGTGPMGSIQVIQVSLFFESMAGGDSSCRCRQEGNLSKRQTWADARPTASDGWWDRWTYPLVNVYIAMENQWKSQFSMGKSTISTGPFSIAFCVFTRVYAKDRFVSHLPSKRWW